MLTHFCMALVGAVFTATGVMKAVNARPFLRQVEEYRLLRAEHLSYAVPAFIGLELVLGTGLVLRASDWLLPAAVVVLVGLTAITIWGTATGRVEDCGCYGGLLLLTPGQGVALNATYLALLAVGWAATGWDLDARPVTPWRIGAVALAGIAGAAAGVRSLRRGPLVEYTLLKTGKAWNRRWVTHAAGPAAASLTDGACLAVFLSKDCPYCKQWVPFLNIIHVQPDLPPVLGIMALDSAGRTGFTSDHAIHFPVAEVSRGLAGLLVQGYPTAVLIEGGVIRQTWFGEMPQAYVDRIKSFYQSISVGTERRPRGFSG
jgi:hypothetical protein